MNTIPLKCTHCDFTGAVPDDGHLYEWRHEELFGAKQHSRMDLGPATESVKEVE